MESVSLGRSQTALDTEVSGVVRALKVIARRWTGGPAAEYRIFTDSQTALSRIQFDFPGPGQRMARKAIRLAGALSSQGVTVKINWVPGHAGIQGNEIADSAARNAALRQRKEDREEKGYQCEEVSVVWLKERRAKIAVKEWGEEIRFRIRARRTFVIPREGFRTRIPRPRQRAPKRLASCSFQLAAGHAMIAPFLSEKFESDLCWWCGSA